MRHYQHQTIICSPDAKRLAVIDVEQQESWVEHCAVAFGRWMLDNPGHKLLSSHVAHSDLTCWVIKPE